ncbi:MAG: AMP-binding protein [Undibacterium sp.]|nr:AMP-binding protein [Opitutaceae bacterium]
MERAELVAVLRATGCAVERGGVFFLGDATAQQMVEGTSNIERRASNAEVSEGGWLGIATGGTSGGVKFARHDERTLMAAVRGFCEHFDIERVNAVDVLPAYHVSGLMARVRCAETGGTHVGWSWKRLEAGERPELEKGSGDWVVSLVPTQLQRLLAAKEAVAWLRGFKVILIGGGPVWAELTEQAAANELPLSLSYGMTETAAMIAASKPEEFLAGARSCGAVLPHAVVSLNAEGVVSVAGESVFRGYWPEKSAARVFQTEDLGRFDERGHLHVLGRRDAVIITGGKKVQPLEVEAALRASGEFADVAVIGMPDAEWGEAVVAGYPAGGREPDWARAVARLAGALKPKRFVAIADWPRNEQGKINRGELRRLATAK